MNKVLPESKGNIFILSAVIKLTDQNYKNVLIPRLESIIHEHGKVRHPNTAQTLPIRCKISVI
jgi:hypothetical protein